MKEKIWANMLVLWCLNIEINPRNFRALSFSKLISKFGQASRGSWLWEDTIASSLVTNVTSNHVGNKSPLRVKNGDNFVRMRGISSSGSDIGL